MVYVQEAPCNTEIAISDNQCLRSEYGNRQQTVWIAVQSIGRGCMQEPQLESKGGSTSATALNQPY